MTAKKITVIGGGTGTYVVLSGLKQYPHQLSAVITMMDSGGSTGRLRDQLGVLPPGDLRQSLVALSRSDVLWRRLFLYRFDSGDLAGHNFGNILLSALEKVCKNYNEVIKTASIILQTVGTVIPVTFDQVQLVAQYSNGKIVEGEGKIDNYQNDRQTIVKIFLKPQATANPEAIKTINQADWIIIGPGDLYTSIIPVLLVKNIRSSLMKTKAKIVFIMNLMTKLGQTTNFKASDHYQQLIKYLGRPVDYILVNNGKIPANILKWYRDHREKLVIDDLDNQQTTVIRENLISHFSYKKLASDRLSRSVLRHSGKRVAQTINQLIETNN